jgi:hypothetical protein
MNTMTRNSKKVETVPGSEVTHTLIPYSVAGLPTKPSLVPSSLQIFPATSSLRGGCWDPYVLGIEPTIYLSEVWLSAAVFAHSRTMEICEDLCSVVPELRAGFQLSSQLFAHGVEQTVKLFGMWIPKAPCKPAPIISEMFALEEEALKQAIEVETAALEEGMDIATGATSAWERRCVPRKGIRQVAKRLRRSVHTSRGALRDAG